VGGQRGRAFISSHYSFTSPNCAGIRLKRAHTPAAAAAGVCVALAAQKLGRQDLPGDVAWREEGPWRRSTA
jgi:hypothetical protein